MGIKKYLELPWGPRLHIFARLFAFLAGVLLVGLGVAVSTTASLGTSPISAIPYSLSLCFQFLSFGAWVILFNLLLIFAEWLLLKKSITLTNIIIQIILTFIFGYCIDLFMWMLEALPSLSYWQQTLMVVAGCFIIATGVCLALWSKISMLPGDGFVMAVSIVTKKDFGRIRLFSDILMSLAGVLICLLVLHNFSGVREGTAIAALATGFFVMLIMKAVRRQRTTG